MSWLRRLIFTLISLAALASALHFSFRLSEPNSTQTGIWLAFALIACVLGWPEIAKSISFMGNSIELRDIKSAIGELKKLAAVYAASALETMQANGRWGGVVEQERQRLFLEIEKMLRDFGFNETEMLSIQKGWHRWVMIDYAFAIILPNSSINHPEIPEEKMQEWHKIYHGMRDEYQHFDSEKIRAIFKQLGCCTPLISNALDDYAYYEKNHKHRDIERWTKRREWFQNK